MSGQGPNRTGDHEDEIQALLAGELDPAAAAELKSRATGDSQLSQAIIEAWQLQRGLDGLQLERAPDGLRRRLRRIPRQRGPGPVFGLPRRAVMATAGVMVLVAGVLWMSQPAVLPPAAAQRAVNPPANDPAAVAQARRDLAIAFFYLDKAGLRVGQRINDVLQEEVAQPVKDSLNQHMPYTGLTRKEKHA